MLSADMCHAQKFLKYFVSDTTKHRKIFLNWIPFVGYAPETRIAGGVVGIATSHLGHDTLKERPSSLQLAAIYTQNKQAFIYLPYQLYFHQQVYSVYGELGYYKYNYRFFGIGNDHPLSYNGEEYFVNYPRVRLTALKKLTKIFYAGIKYSFDNFDITSEDSSGELIHHTIPGSKGGNISGLGVATIIDSRDNVFFPSHGTYTEIFIQPFTTWMGSNYTFTLFSINSSAYFKTFPKQVIAFNLYYESVAGTAPFYLLPELGGANTLRGLYEGDYRDNYAAALQAEYRFAIWKFLGGDLFGDMGEVVGTPDEAALNILRYTYGFGIRIQIDPKQKINLRGDIGFSDGSPAFYFTYGEAF